MSGPWQPRPPAKTPPRLPRVTVSRPPAGLEDDELLRAERALAQQEDEELRRAEESLAAQEQQQRPPAAPAPAPTAAPTGPTRRPARDFLNKATAAEETNKQPTGPEYESPPERDPIVITAPPETDAAKVKAARSAVAAAQGAPPIGQALAGMMGAEPLTRPGRAPVHEEQVRFDPAKIQAAQQQLTTMAQEAATRGDAPTARHLQRLAGSVEAYLAAYEAQSTTSGSILANLAATFGETSVDRALGRGAAELPEALATVGITEDDGTPLSFAAPFGWTQFKGMVGSDIITSVGGGMVARKLLGAGAELADDVARGAVAGSRAARALPKVAAAARKVARYGTGAEITVQQQPLGALVQARRMARGLNPLGAGTAAAAPGRSVVGSAIASGVTQGQLVSTARQVQQAQAQGAPVLEPAIEGVLMGTAIGPLGEFAARGVGQGISRGARGLRDAARTYDAHLFNLASPPKPPPPPSPEQELRLAWRAELRQPGKPGVVTWTELQSMLADGMEPAAIVERYSAAATPEAQAAQVAALERWRSVRTVGDAPTPATVEPTPAVPVPHNPPRPWLLPQPPEQKLLAAGVTPPVQGPAILMPGTAAESGRPPNAQALVSFQRQLRDASARRARAAAEAGALDAQAREAAAAAEDPRRMPFRELLRRAQSQGLRHGVGPLALAGGEDENMDPRARAMLQLGGLAMLAGSIRAFHGSPHLFDADPDAPLGKFRRDRIGSEGGLKYGYGHYVATHPEVARAYIPEPESLQWAKGFMGGERAMVFADAAYDDLADIDFGNKAGPAERTVDRVIEQLEKNLRDLEDPDDVDAARRAIKYLKDGDIVLPPKRGALYEVDVDVDDDAILDLDKPLREQSPTVREILQREVGAAADDTRTGSDIMWHLEQLAPDGAEQVSETLRDLGIRGLRYLDAGSRDVGTGTHNYVIFDDAFLRVKGRQVGAEGPWTRVEERGPRREVRLLSVTTEGNGLRHRYETPSGRVEVVTETGLDADGGLEILDVVTEGKANALGPTIVRALRDDLTARFGAQRLHGFRTTGANPLRDASVRGVGPSPVSAPHERARVTSVESGPPEAEVAHGSAAAAQEVVDEVGQRAQATWDAIAAGRPLTSAERIAGMRFTERAKRGWYDVRGLRVTRPDHLAEILRPLRSQKMERMHLLYVDGRGKIRAHVMETSGFLNAVAFGRPGGTTVGRNHHEAFRQWMIEVVKRGQRLKAKGIWLAHNHPTGIPSPSIDDKRFTQYLADEFARVGLPVKGHVVIDHTSFGLLHPTPGSGMMNEGGGSVPTAAGQPDVTQGSRSLYSGQRGMDEEIAFQVRKMETKGAAQVVYLDTQHRIVAVEPHGFDAMSRMDKWLTQRKRGLGAQHAVVVTSDWAVASRMGIPAQALSNPGAFDARFASRLQLPKGIVDVIYDPLPKVTEGADPSTLTNAQLAERAFGPRTPKFVSARGLGITGGEPSFAEADLKYSHIVREEPREPPMRLQAEVEAANAARPEPGGIVPQEYHNAGRYAFTPGVVWTPEEAADLAARVQRVLRPVPEQDVVADALEGPLAVQHSGQGAWEGQVAPMTSYELPKDATFEQVAVRAAAQQLLFGQEAGVAIKFHGDELDLSAMSPAERVLRGDRIKRMGLVADLSLAEKDRMLQMLATDNVGATATETAPGQWTVFTVDEQGLPDLFDVAFEATVETVSPRARRFLGHAEVDFYSSPRQGAAALLRYRPGSLRALAGVLDRVEPEYVASAQRLGGDAAVERTRALIAARKRGLLALADAVDHPSPPALTGRDRLSVEAAHLSIANQRNASGAGPALRALTGEAYVDRLAQEFAHEADAAIQQAVELTGDPGATTRWYGATIRHAEDIAATFGIPEMVGNRELAVLFHTVSSILSNGQAVFREYLSAIPVVQQYLRTGKLSMLLPEAEAIPAAARERTSPFRGAGAENPVPLSRWWKAHQASLRKLQRLLDERGLVGAVEYLTGDQVLTPRGKVRTKRIKETGQVRPVTPTVYEFSIKVGQYVRDKLGISKAGVDGVTVDVWMHRLERMLRGEGPPVGRGPTQAETLRIQEATERARRLLEAKHPGIAARDIQAALWERAKMLYREGGAKEKPGAYDTLADAGRQWASGAGSTTRDPAQRALMQRYLPHTTLPAALGMTGDEQDQFDGRVALEGLAIALLGHAVGTAAERALGIGAATEVAKRFGTTASLVAAGAVLGGSDDPDVARYGGGMALALAGLHAMGTAPLRFAGREVLETTRRLAAQSPAMARTFGWVSPSLVLSDESLAALAQARRTVTRGRAIGAELAAKSARAGAAADRFTSDLVEGEAWEAAAQLSPEARQAALEVAARYQEVMREVMAREIALGTIPDEVVARLPHDRYLPRVYAEHLGENVLAPTEAEYTHGRSLTIQGPRRRVLDVPVYEAMDDLEAMERALEFARARGDRVQIDGAQDAVRMAQTQLAEAMRRRDAARLALGEVREFSWRAPAAVEDAFGRTAAGELLATLRTTNDVHPEWLAAASARDAAQQLWEQGLDAPTRQALREQLAAAEARLAEVKKRLPKASLEAAETVPQNPQRGPEGRRLQWLAEYEAAAEEVSQLRQMIATAGDEAQRQTARQQMEVANQVLRDLAQRLEADGQGQWVQLPSSAGYGPLAGAIVKRAVADELRGVADPEAWGKFMRFWKRVKTVYNPGTHVGNTASNVVMLHMAGLSWWQQVPYMQRAISDLRAGGPMSRTLREAGVLGQAELAIGTPPRASQRTPRQTRALRASTRPETAAALGTQGVGMPTRGDAVANVGSAINQAATGLYKAEDDVFRIAAFDFARRVRGLDDAAAAEWSRQALGDFSRGQSSRAVRLARNSVVPFIAYPLAALPTFAAHVIQRPWRWVSLTAPLLLLNEWGQAESKHDLGPADVAPRERDTVFGLLLPNLVQVPMSRDGRDRIPAMDLSRWTPLSALVTGAPPATLGGAIDAPQLLQPSGPLVDIAMMAANRESAFTDRKLVDPMQSGADKAATVARAVGDLMLPSAAGYSLRRLVKDVRRNDPQGVALDVMGYAGVRPRYYGKGDDRERARKDLEKRLRDIDFEARLETRNARRAPGLRAEIQAERARQRAAAKRAYEDRVSGR